MAEFKESSDATRILHLISQEGESFDTTAKVGELSKLVQTMIDQDADQDEAQDIPLPNVKSQVLAKVVEFLQYYPTDPMIDIEKPIKSTKMEEIMSQEWYAKFVDVEQELLFELILAANYMDIKPLLDVTCCAVASQIKNKTPDEIRATFNLPNDFTPEEVEQVKKANQWANE
eukprot:CAMPEP_0181314110 /NCGR_PEP_ID=MMETSP1101-20121128/14631_1 /TAXON_ID=46948 /ORGANISM="Rhodomonas abbreviata, Strain Caron Lab Isolate" /LENGTH=172 /DNA_ID=CAMNT_0023421157 /DNA_START=40 /DNA_END=558 /DNA_ORIENTATION=-